MNKPMQGAILAAAVAALFAAGQATAGDTSKPAEFKCEGANACGGKGACGGAGHECAGKNACKGKGFTKTASEAECKAAKEAASKDAAKH